jgi:hypothetical protein
MGPVLASPMTALESHWMAGCERENRAAMKREAMAGAPGSPGVGPSANP